MAARKTLAAHGLIYLEAFLVGSGVFYYLGLSLASFILAALAAIASQGFNYFAWGVFEEVQNGR